LESFKDPSQRSVVNWNDCLGKGSGGRLLGDPVIILWTGRSTILALRSLTIGRGELPRTLKRSEEKEGQQKGRTAVQGRPAVKRASGWGPRVGLQVGQRTVGQPTADRNSRLKRLDLFGGRGKKTLMRMQMTSRASHKKNKQERK